MTIPLAFWPLDFDPFQIDVSIPIYTHRWIMNMAVVITTIAIIIYSTPIFTVVIVPILILYYITQVMGPTHYVMGMLVGG